jgi:chorismate mutase
MSIAASEAQQPDDPERRIGEARAEIDAIDSRILAILADRVRCNEVIAAAKAEAGVTMPLRPAREVRMLRRLIAEAPTGVDADLVFDVWRAMIAANVRRQRPVEVVVGGANDVVRLFDTARRHFGGAARIVSVGESRDALNRVVDQPSTVAVLPWPSPSGLGAWWAMLTERRYANLRLIAALPMRGEGEPEGAVVAAGAQLEEAGGDHTFGLAFDPHHRCTRALNMSHLPGREASRVRETVLIEMEGFVPPSDGRIAVAINEGLEGLRVIGSYARV